MQSKFLLVPFLNLAFAASALGAPSAADEPPPGLQAPAGEVLVLRAQARGTQSYECTSAGDHAEWKSKGPNAVLNGADDAPLGIHYAGPTWEATDGSKVVGAAVASAPAADGRSIPQLLLKAREHSGDGTFAKVRTIQRLATHGGEAPAVRCGQAEVGRKIDVPYSATYVFFGARD